MIGEHLTAGQPPIQWFGIPIHSEMEILLCRSRRQRKTLSSAVQGRSTKVLAGLGHGGLKKVVISRSSSIPPLYMKRNELIGSFEASCTKDVRCA